MSSTTNTAINSRSMNGVITISDGQATLENGDLNCDDIISSSLNTSNINTSLLTCSGKFESNLNGPYTIPVSISNLTGLLISYGNVTNSGATDFTNFQSTYTSTQGGFRFFNKSATQTLTNLAIIDNSQTYFSSPLTGCLAETPLNNTSIVNKTYVDSNFLDRTNDLTQNVNGLKTFQNNTNFTGSLLSRTNIKLSEYENTPATNTITLNFPMSETIALRTTPATSNPMTINLPLLTNNERGYVFTFNKLFDQTYGNFPVTFNTSGGQAIYPLINQSGTPTSNTTLLSVEKIQCKLAVGWFGSLLYWIEQTDFSTYDRYKLTEWGNATTTNTLTLTFPLPPTIALRTSTESTMTINLPALTTLERGQIFTFVKLNSYNYNVIFNTSSGQWIFPLNNITGGPTTNSTIFPSNKKLTKLAVGWFGTFTYWVEASDYSTFDVEQNNLIYARLASPNTFTNTNTFNSSLISNNITSPSVTGTNNIYTNLSLDGGIINVGARGSNININCNLNIVESVYGNTTKITTINQEGNSCRFTNNGSTNGNFIFTINEGSTYNTLVINKTSVDVAGDALIDGNLILYDTTPSSTKNVIIGMVGNDLFFTPYLNVPSSTYNFKVSDSASTITTPLIINSTNTTIANRIHLNAGSRYYSGLSYTEVLQTGAQLTIKPVHDNGTIALFSTNTSGTQTQQLLIDTTGISSPRIAGTNIFSTNYNSPSGFMTIGASTETGNINLGTNLTLGNVNIGNTTAGSFKINIRGSLFSTGQATFQNFCPKSETDPAVANDLVKLSYLQNNFVDKTTAQTGIAGNKTFTSQATFQNFCPKSETDPAVANDLVKLSYLQNNFCNLSTSQLIGGEKTFTDDLTAPNIFCNTALYFRDIDASIKKALIFHQADIVYFDTLTVFDNYWKFKCNGVEQLIISDLNTTIENKLKCNSELIHKETQIMNKVKTISTTSPATFEFPLAERWMFTTTGSTQINVTLPELTLSSQAGFNFSFFKTASVTNSVLFTCQGTNKIRGLNSITDLTSDTRISGTGTTGGFYTAEVSAGSFVWISY